MIAGLVRHHPAMKGLPKLMGMAAVASILVTNLLMFLSLRSGPEVSLGHGPRLVLQITFTLAAAGLLFRGANCRTSRWHQGLPVPAVTLWRSHYLALLAGLLFLLVFQGVILTVFFAFMGELNERLSVSIVHLAPVFVSPALVLIMVAGLTASFRTDLVDLSRSVRWPRFRLAVLGLSTLLVVILHYLPLVVGFFPAAAGALIAFRARRGVPSTLDLGDDAGAGSTFAGSENWRSLAQAPDIYRGDSPFIPLSVLNQLYKIPYPYVSLVVLFAGAFTSLMAGLPIYEGHAFPELFRLNNGFLVVYLLFSFMGEFLLKLYRVDALPVKRHDLLRYMVAPGLVAILLGYGGARLFIEWKSYPVEEISFQDSYGKYGISVAPGFYDIMPRGKEVEVTAPWGETHVAEARQPLPAYPSPLGGNSEFLTEGKSSPGFVAWQFSRAVKEIYGADIAPDELARRYLEPDSDGKISAPRGGFPVAEDFDLKAPSGGPVGAFLMGPILVGWLLLLGLFFRWLRYGATVRKVRVRWWTTMAVLFLLHILQVLNHLPFYSPFGMAVLVFGAARRMGALGAMGWISAYGLVAMLSYISWRFASRAFKDLEAPRG